MTRPLREVIAEAVRSIPELFLHDLGIDEWHVCRLEDGHTLENPKWIVLAEACNEDEALERRREIGALMIADAVIAALPQTEVSVELVSAVTDLLSVMDYGDEDPDFTDDEAVSYRQDKDGNPVDDPMTFGHIRRVRQALALPVDGWRPIETAPKDGTHILVQILSEGYGGTMQAVVYWKPDGGGKWPWKVVPDGDRWNIDCVKSWQPLPAPDRGGEDA